MEYGIRVFIYIYILSIYVPSTHAYTHVLRLSLGLTRKGNTTIIEATFLGSGCGGVV